MAIMARGVARGGDGGRAGINGAGRIHGAWVARVCAASHTMLRAKENRPKVFQGAALR